MNPKIKKFAPHLKTLSVAKPAMCKAMIKTADPDMINCLSECAHNILKGNVPLRIGQKQRLARHKKDLRLLSKRSTAIKRKKKILQKGGFLGGLLAPLVTSVLPAVAQGVGGLINSLAGRG